MKLVISSDKKYNKIFRCDPCRNKVKTLNLTIVTMNDSIQKYSFRENSPICIDDIKSINSAYYGYKIRTICVKETLSEFIINDSHEKYLFPATCCNSGPMNPGPRKDIHGGAGFNDLLCGLYTYIELARSTNRKILYSYRNLENYTKTPYNINLNDVLSFNQEFIITDSDIIESKVDEYKNDMTFIRPWIVQGSNGHDNIVSKIKSCNSTIIALPFRKHRQYATGRGANSVHKFFLTSVVLKSSISNYIKETITSLPEKFTFFQVRNTDRKCNYLDYIAKNISRMEQNIYLATDSILVLNTVKSKFPNHIFYNFTTFTKENKPLHFSDVDGIIQMRDLLCDIAIIFKSKSFFTNSGGGFRRLCEYASHNKHLNFLK